MDGWSSFGKETGVVAVAGGGQDVVSNDVAKGTPSQYINKVESHGIVGFEDANILLCTRVTSLEVCDPVLLRQPLLRHVLPLEVEEHEPPQEQRQPCAQAYHQRWAQLSSHASPNSNHAPSHHRTPPCCERPQTLEAHARWLLHLIIIIMVDGW
ncbi:hypothetical protein PIB30_033510 [Stylosanthes scabra]|uniref:Uncharacterized protein n=1 Tax=Stylosanthes scabra TaxID=79078 RepID=A0ABU6QCG5_9FABA|nr:hypothetical protein [Stylosanthes scabra]